MPIGLDTYGDVTRPEDVTDFIVNVSFKKTPFFSGLQESVAENTLHEWLNDTYAPSGDNSVIESSDATIVDMVTPTRDNNVVQIFRKVITVSDTQRAIKHYGENDPYVYQTRKKMVEMARDIEHAAIRGTRASGSSGVARKMSGAIEQISTNKTARTSGTSFTFDELAAILRGVYDGGSDDEIDEVHTGSYLKTVISAMTAGKTKNVDASDKRLVSAVDVIETDFGLVKIFTNREVPTNAVLAVDSSKWRVAYLTGRRPTHILLAKTGSATKGMIEGELTLESLAESTSAYRSGYFIG